ncbi:hypothetical protein PHLGIDRAFT_124233 [Phlebiopsis gigantea 11061_1 CR5-6]|uniref:ABC transporter domain-containing protein n=1 Tax=Phlebiopsis gigantea (strain 11061_1 CR5-6) TaxID=745531 RepID=A0A0C3SE46_PHLG1|nr:hypothetical protein PHLGIDRAFT_124233 [Phlebiopsis gigantea 11061_1 CR5-6]
MRKEDTPHAKDDINPWESKKLDPALSSHQSGVWRVVSQRPVKKSLRSYWEPITSRLETARGAGYILNFLTDVYHLEPLLFTIYLLSHAFSGVNDAFTLLYTNKLLSKVEQTITSSEGADIKGIMRALALHIAVKTLAAVWKWAWRRPEPILNTRIAMFCKIRVMKVHLNLDLPSSQDANNVMYSSMPYMAQHALRSIIESVRLVSSMISQIIVIVQLMKEHDDGIMLVGLCLLYSIVQSKLSKSQYIQEMIYYASDRSYRRLLALFEVATMSDYKQEVIGGALGNYLIEEYEKTSSRIPNAMDEPDIFFANNTPFESCGAVLVESLPLMFCILRVVQNPAEFSLTYLATLQRTSSVIQDTLFSFSWIDNILNNITFVKLLYVDDSSKTQKIPPGEMAFPPPDSHRRDSMSIEMCDVNFKYPGKDNEKFALRNLSFKIPPSSLVVIVGANGSGKTSIVKLLAQLYRPTSGQILIGGQPAETYIPQDLYNATALLTQKHSIFPLSMAENIGLGDPSEVDNFTKIVEAARMGGAYELIESFEEKWEQELDPIQTCGSRAYRLPDGPLKELRAAVERCKEISGGEAQRIAAARTFMRIMSEKTRFVIVDEPTSAIDPAGEYELFEQLRSMRNGKTMIFVTHRFGHLTKYADLILCMKAGELVESGTHHELMERSGEYYKLYQVQAKAFTNSQD